MLDEIKYEAGASIGVYDLNGSNVVSGSPDALRESSWSYDLGATGVEGASREPTEVKIACVMLDGDYAPLRRAADRDIALGASGRLHVNGVFKRANLTGWSRRSAAGGAALYTVTAALQGGCWMRERRVEFEPTASAASSALDLPYDLPHDLAAPPARTWIEGCEWCRCMMRERRVEFEPTASAASSALDLPYDLPHDLAAPPARTWIEGCEWCRCMIGFVVYGPCSNPRITIGGNVYRVDVSVPDGGHLTIDPLSRTVVLTDSRGGVVNAFGDASRGHGEGSGEYVFERLPEGVSEVGWSNSFSFTAIVYEEEAMPPCEMR